jgi:triosephosphate isomerase
MTNDQNAAPVPVGVSTFYTEHTMRKPFVAGNWKMNLSKAEGVALAKGLVAKAAEFGAVDVAVIPAFVHIDAVGQAIAGSVVGLGAQDVYFEKNGAFTGEVSLQMLTDLHVKYVLIGHSERRHVIGETDALLNKKLKAVIGAGLIAVLCVGETIEERKANRTLEVVGRQLVEGLKDVGADKAGQLVIAYEPVWAIGTGLVATPAQAQEVHAFIRAELKKILGDAAAAGMRIQYGGSVKASNAAELMSQPDIDGALVGGAALKVEDFLGIITGTAKAKK